MKFVLPCYRSIATVAIAAVAITGVTSLAVENVKLGDPSLTSGIPGAGPLQRAEIQKFLSNPANHVELVVELPEGLSAGKEAVFIPADNPLT
ncbi:MAG: cytochrome-c peroxidase, partial [Pirellula sp.]|nr:cytochrome-c peroxidase [Pirellula sp.]